MDKDRRVSIETINTQFDVSMGAVHTITGEELKMRKICAKFVLTVLREDQKERRSHDSRIYCYDPETKRQSSQWKHAGSPTPKKARQS